MQQRTTPGSIALLTVPPLFWAGNAIVGRLVREQISPLTLNLVRWAVAFVLLLPFAHAALRRDSPLWTHWKRYAALGLLGIGCYNAFQYLALQTSTPINVTLVGASLPLWMLATGALFFGARVSRREVVGAVLSMAGVLLVLGHGDARQLLALRLVPGDLYMIAGTVAWAFYSWMLSRTQEPAALRAHWALFLMAQLVFGLAWSGAFAVGEWTFTDAHIDFSGALAAAMLYVGLCPRCWPTAAGAPACSAPDPKRPASS